MRSMVQLWLNTQEHRLLMSTGPNRPASDPARQTGDAVNPGTHELTGLGTLSAEPPGEMETGRPPSRRSGRLRRPAAGGRGITRHRGRGPIHGGLNLGRTDARS